MRALPPLALLVCLASSPTAAQDTTTVRADGPAVWEHTDLVEEVRIGLLEGGDRDLFGQVRYVVSPPAGSAWVVDAQGPRLRIYDPVGRYVRDVSRPGEGPGEIASVMGIDVTPDGRVAVWDLRNGRVSLFREDGESTRCSEPPAARGSRRASRSTGTAARGCSRAS